MDNDLFSSLFASFGNIGSYESRKVGTYEQDDGGLYVSTCLVTDGLQPYETAVRHRLYNDDRMIIVEAYDTPELAKAGHDKWVARMSAPIDQLPDVLVDCANAMISRFIGTQSFPKQAFSA